MATPPIIISHPGEGVVTITLNRPQALNAISVDLLNDLVTALREHADARVIVLEGAGDRAFCAGEDLKQTLAPITGSAQELRNSFHKLQDITRLTSNSRAVIVSAVQGYAIGGGAEIALAADFIVAGPKAIFKFPEVTIGHAATGGITLRLSHMVGLLKAKQLLITGRNIGADEALAIGLVSEVSEDPKARAVQLALELAGLPAVALAESKSSIERAVFPNMDISMADEVNVASYCFAQSDADKAFSNFAARKSSGKPILSARDAVQEKQSSENNNGLCEKSRFRDINTALGHVVSCFPDRPFIRFGGEDTTFRQFDSAVAKLSGGLREAGLQQGDRLLVMMRNSLEMVYTWMAANRLGAVWVPINFELKSITLKHVIQAANPKLAVIDAEFWGTWQSLGLMESSMVFIQGPEAISSTGEFASLMSMGTPITQPVKVTSASTSAFLYTSGTTGKSKPCVLSHEYFIIQASILIDGCTLRGDDVLYCPFPLFHADATALTVIPAILLGAVAALSIRFSASRFWDEIRASRATVYDFMGATLALTYKQPPSLHDRDHRIRLAWGVPIPQFSKEYEERFNHRLITLYGSVEASIPIFQQGRDLPLGSCGRAMPGYQIRIADDMDEELPPNTPGQLLLRSDAPNAFFHGYFNDHANTAAAFSGCWLHTGDIAKVDEEGNVYFVGRTKDIIRRRGENVNASELEEEFLQHPDVVIAAAYGIPSQLGSGTEQDIKIAVQLRTGSTVDEKTLWDWAVDRVARFQVPSVIEIVLEIKRTPTGKIEKHSLSIEGGKRFELRSVPRDR
ncbi:putative coenzyme A synthetase [Xylariales sp. PMI_506]|nr:putative coenzyme A synthetase [Xylariales sp. PMI_506]